jgi:outer membrane protein OmpA-like peptidoglycan-associated protein
MRLAGAAVVVLALAASGCGGQLRERCEGIRKVLEQARNNGAYKCAPRELAMGESHLDFTIHELDNGNYYRAIDEVEIADDNARLAFAHSPPDKCNPKGAPPPKPVEKPKDRDGDGILDKVDKCPDDPEDKDGFQDEDGCPDPDNDQDGILDKADKCPNDPEDKDGFEDDDGCPDLDNDKDTLADKDDKCPNEPGPVENQGCPDKDRDGDTVVDRLDKCPDVPGPPDNDGCPKPKFIVVKKDRIELKQKIHFETAKSTIKPDSFAMLTEIAEVLKARPEVKVRIEGHTDKRGGMNYNMKLSQARADSVKEFLVGQGVASDRMETRGFGYTVPIADNRTSAGREQNRRTEFIITSQ